MLPSLSGLVHYFGWRRKRGNGWRQWRDRVDDWTCLALLGVSMGTVALAVEIVVDLLQKYHMMLYRQCFTIGEPSEQIALAYVVWSGNMVILTCLSAVLVHYLAPAAIGAGIPEMKTILRGVVLSGYLSMRTLVFKILGLTLVLSSGLPIGKEGPFVHIASILASHLFRLCKGSKVLYENESRSTEMLAAGCAVGVACTFSAPIGGVLFSIEVTSVFFAVRNYFRGFFAAAISAVLTRVLLPVIKGNSDGLFAYYQTFFPTGRGFVVEELPIFAFLGVLCGLLGALYVLLHRSLVLFLRRNWLSKRIFQRYWILYPILISLIIGFITFPEGTGRLLSGRVKFSRTLPQLFSVCAWTEAQNATRSCHLSEIVNWRGTDGHTSVFVTLTIFSVVYFILSIIASTIPIPAGNFMPLLVLGASLGRIVGELIHVVFNGEINDHLWNTSQDVYPGIYAVVGAAAFAGAVTRSVSVVVIIYELTNQQMVMLPVLCAVIVANAVAARFQPSIYDSIVRMKHLPYLPDITHSSSTFHSIRVNRIMKRPVHYLTQCTTYRTISDILTLLPRVNAFPVVESEKSLALIGSIGRTTLVEMLEERVGSVARFNEVVSRLRRHIDSTRSHVSNLDVLDGKRSHSTHSLNLIQHDDESPTRSRPNSRYMGTPPLKNYEDAKHKKGIFGVLEFIGKERVKKEAREEIIRLFDYDADEKESWERRRLAERVQLPEEKMDAAPFQLSSRTSLFKMHSLFSLLGVQRAYVTRRGQLEGVIAQREVREAIERVDAGLLLEEDDLEMQAGKGEAPVLHEGDVYDGDSSDYEDNLQGRLEVVSPSSDSTTQKSP